MCSRKDLEEIVSKLKQDLINDLKKEFELIVQFQTKELKAEVSHLREEVAYLRNCVKTANHENDELEQYGRRMMLEISGIPGDTGAISENVEEKIIDFCESNEIDVKASDIDKVHRLGRWRNDATINRRVIVKFTNSKARYRLYSARKSLPNRIFIQESLTKKRQQLAFSARQLKRRYMLNVFSQSDLCYFYIVYMDFPIVYMDFQDMKQISVEIVTFFVT
jgi:hypothetical protein